MKTLEMKQNLLDTINGIDERDTDLLEKLNNVIRDTIRQNEWKKETKDPNRKVSKTWEAAMRLKGSLIVNDPKFLL